jgi:hypothetical protein
MTIYGDGRIRKWELKTGEIMKEGKTPFRGPCQVMGDRIYIFGQLKGELAEYDHIHMKEADTDGLRKERDELSRGKNLTICALLVTKEAFIWTSLDGTVNGVERRLGRGTKRICWQDSLQTLMPFGVPPKSRNGYMYLSAISTKPAVPIGLVCYEEAEHWPLADVL